MIDDDAMMMQKKNNKQILIWGKPRNITGGFQRIDLMARTPKNNKWQKETVSVQGNITDFGVPFTRMSHTRTTCPSQDRRACVVSSFSPHSNHLVS